MLRILCAEILICEIFLLEKDIKMTMQALQRNSQNIYLLMFQKTNREKKIKIAMKAKLMYHAIRTKKILIIMISSLASILKNMII